MPDQRPPTNRLFIAVTPPAATIAFAARAIEGLERSGVAARWTTPAQLHLTLAFLGDDVPDARLAGIAAAVDAVAAAAAPFAVEFGGLGAFPDARRPRVIWLGVRQGADGLGDLQSALAARLALLGFPPEERGFHPHLTLGRIDRDRLARPSAIDLEPLLERLDGLSAGAGRITQILLFASVADGGRHRYDSLHAATLRGAAAGSTPR